jgi:hypothetical protein
MTDVVTEQSQQNVKLKRQKYSKFPADANSSQVSVPKSQPKPSRELLQDWEDAP